MLQPQQLRLLLPTMLVSTLFSRHLHLLRPLLWLLIPLATLVQHQPLLCSLNSKVFRLTPLETTTLWELQTIVTWLP